MWEKRQNTRFLNGIPQARDCDIQSLHKSSANSDSSTTDFHNRRSFQVTLDMAKYFRRSDRYKHKSHGNSQSTDFEYQCRSNNLFNTFPDSSNHNRRAHLFLSNLILGALFASMIAYLLHKHRSQNTSEAKYTPTAFSSSSVELGKHTEYTRVPQPPASRPLPNRLVGNGDIDLSLLPAPASPSRIHSRLTSLFAQIHTHITTFYRDVPAPITPSMHSALAVFGDHVAPFLQDTPAPTAVLQHVLAAHILRITDPVDGEIWPRELVSFDTHTHTHGGDAMAKARCLHRRLAVGLYTAGPTSERFSTALVEAAQGFALCFFAWALPMAHEAERESDLVRVMQLALETRVWLCGQEEEYEFVWEDVGRRGVVVVPRLLSPT
ncbi:hypothetical protein SNOG_15650 [Parastagonospora nodorum SN15]|uniref:Uncharacterized protein n=1 Tax=Phaeosphaeria nodorum (strain SN15 / ATCC MYA-4574 / FGSC 10173) TaxID=321614 RepID=Q0TY26_PHANO|nr:hypothetical protein SNOG_15650 [Parastagonospora nodorum SN15]EAT77025.1 hypothetical protein SNOG_15650 [Parastagonospora nodorum SN15]